MFRSTILIPLALSVMIAGIPARRPATAAEEPAAEKAQPTPADEMAIRQEKISDKFTRMEQLMLKMAELDAATNPRRSALLKRGVAQAKNRHIRLQLDTIVGLLQDQKFGRSSDLQQDVNGDLRALLNLLLSENRPERSLVDMDLAFRRIFGQGLWIIVGSMVAFLVGQIVDVFPSRPALPAPA